MHTCQTNGKFLRFATAINNAAIRHNPPGALYPVHLDSAAITFVLRAGCEANAKIEAPATTILAVCTIAIVLLRGYRAKGATEARKITTYESSEAPDRQRRPKEVLCFVIFTLITTSQAEARRLRCRFPN